MVGRTAWRGLALRSSAPGRWQAMLDTMPHEHRNIEQWAAKLEATLDEEQERKRRDANFDPKNLPPYEERRSALAAPR